MNKEVLHKLVDVAVQEAKAQAVKEIKKLDRETIGNLVDAELARVITPLEQEITFTKSWWVKIRNRFYILVLKQSTNTIVDSIVKKVSDL